MTIQRRLAGLLAVLALVCIAAIGFSFSRADSVPSTQPAVSPEATTQPSISPDAHKLLGQVHDAYTSLKSLAVSGTINADFDIDGVKAKHSDKFTGLYSSTGQFRSEMHDGDAIAGNTGQKIYVFLPNKNRYDMIDAPKGSVRLEDLGEDVAALLCEQDLSLALAMSADPATAISQTASSIDRGKDVDIDGKSYPAISIAGPAGDTTLVLDPSTHLLRRVVTDQTKIAHQQGAQVVKSALITADYTNTPGAPAEASAFAWTPPPGAQPNASENTGPNAGADIEGKPAPAFTLTGLDGKEVSLESLKGSVCVFDFWATWCGPCCASLPHLDAIYKDVKPQGVHFFAINLQEGKDAVQKFVNDTKLSIPVLLDSDGKVTDQYDTAGAIPFTVVVGKDGKVFKAGFFGGSEDQLRPIIQSALSK